MPRKDELKDLIDLNQRRLHSLRKQRAIKGLNTEPEIVIQIEDLEAELKQFQAELDELQSKSSTPVTAKEVKKPSTEHKKLSQKRVGSADFWTKLAAIGTVIGVIVALIFGVLQVIEPNQEGSSVFTYQVRVEAIGTNETIPNATVTIEVGGQAPLDNVTDSNGVARIFISATHAGKPARLIVEAEGYRRYRQEMDLVEEVLPDIVRLEPS